MSKAAIDVSADGFAATPGEARLIAEEIGAPTVIKSQLLSRGPMKGGGGKCLTRSRTARPMPLLAP